MAIEHDYFGLLGDEAGGEIHWSESIDVDERSVDVDLEAPDAAAIVEESLDVAAAMIAGLDRLDHDAREAFVGELASAASATVRYLIAVVDEFGDDAVAEALSWESGDRHIDILRSLELVRVGFRPQHNGHDERFVALEFQLLPDETELELIAYIDVQGDVVGTEALL